MRYLLVLLLPCLMSTFAAAQPMDWQKVLDGAYWSWDPAATTPLWCAKRQSDVPVAITVDPHEYKVKMTIGTFPLTGHENTVFVARDGVLVYASFGSSSNGATIVAVDLATGREKWSSRVTGIGAMQHSAYSNRINLTAGKDAITVTGYESFGLYTEYKRMSDGETIATRVFSRTRLSQTPDRWLISWPEKGGDPFLLRDSSLVRAVSGLLTDTDIAERGKPGYVEPPEVKAGRDIRGVWEESLMKDYPSLQSVPVDQLQHGHPQYDTVAIRLRIDTLLKDWNALAPKAPPWTTLAVQMYRDKVQHDTDREARLELLARLLTIEAKKAAK